MSVGDAKARLDTTYQFEMDGSDEVKYIIDARHYGNEAAFINHSCDPNLVAICVQVERIDPAIHRIGLFSTRRIFKGELCRRLDIIFYQSGAVRELHKFIGLSGSIVFCVKFVTVRQCSYCIWPLYKLHDFLMYR